MIWLLSSIISLSLVLTPNHFLVYPSTPLHPVPFTFVSSDMNVGQYVHAVGTISINRTHPNGTPLVKLEFPVLDIFDPDGRLIYHGTRLEDNIKILNEGFPESTRNYVGTPDPLGLSLDDLLQLTPAFQNIRQTVLSSHHYVIYSISLSATDCTACDTQVQAIDSLKRKLARHDVDILTLILTK
jgi:hypothetical protein